MHAIHRRLAGENQRLTEVIERVSSTDKKTRRRRKNKNYWGKPRQGLKKGFDAFAVKQTTITSDGKKVISVEAVAPETGIHSRAWAQEIVPQTGFLSLPIEIRHRIYDELLDDAVIQNPRKHGKKYITTGKTSTTLETYNNLLQISRQTYVDVVGGSLLYHFARFAFSSPDTMSRYLSCINPAHKSAIRKVDLTISLTRHQPAIRPLAFSTLSCLPSLQSLKVIISLAHNLCYRPLGAIGTATWPSTLRKVEVVQPVVDKLLKTGPWKDIQGLSEFQMSFQGTRLAGAPVTNYNGIRQKEWQDGFLTDDPRLLEVEKVLRELLTKRRD